MKKRNCRLEEKGISCLVKLPNGRTISHVYDVQGRNPEEYLDIVEEDFFENIVKPAELEFLKKGNLIDKTQGYLKTKDLECRREMKFEDRGSVRVLTQVGRCIEKEERWKKLAKGMKGIAKSVID